MAKPLLELRHVSYQYPAIAIASDEQATSRLFALRDVSLTIAKGEYVAIVGSNGSGKSTLAKLLTGLMRPSDGEVLLFGSPIVEAFENGTPVRHVGMVFQDPDVQTVASMVEEDVAFALENLSYPFDEMHKQVEIALKTVDMWAYRHRDVDSLSGGQRQRVAIAGVLAANPTCIIFDEATSMLDPLGRRDIQSQMQKLAGAGHAIVNITHRMEEALQADRVIVLNEGAIALAGSPGEVFRDADRLRAFHLLPPGPALALTVLQPYVVTKPEIPSAKDVANVILLVNPEIKAQVGAQARGVHDVMSQSEKVMSQASSAVKVCHLTHTYAKGTPLATVALSDVSFSVHSGEIVAIVGATGSGKSTLSLYLNGLHQARKAVVSVFGMDPADKNVIQTVRRRVGMLFQKSEDQIFESLIGDEVAFGPLRFGASTDKAREDARWAMAQVGLDFTLLNHPTHGLSGGERRRVALASVLAQRPDMLVLDEPTMALDPAGRQTILHLLAKLRREEGMTIIFVTHSLEEVAEIADCVLVLRDGHLVLDTTAREWLADSVAVQQHGFDLPEIAIYTADICRELGIPVPRLLPLTAPAFEAWLKACLGAEKPPKGGE